MKKDLQLLGQLATELLINAEDMGCDYLPTSATLVADDVKMLERVESFCQEPKVWIVRTEEVDDYVNTNQTHRIFFDLSSAKAHFNSEVDGVRQDFDASDWIVEEYDTSYTAYDDGYYARNHFAIDLFSVSL